MKKKLIVLPVAFLIFYTMIIVFAQAATYASDQIDSGWVDTQAFSSGQIAVEFYVSGTGKMSKIGADCIILYEKNANNWRVAETRAASQHPSLYTTQAYSHCNTEYFSAVPGRQYYARLYAVVRKEKCVSS